MTQSWTNQFRPRRLLALLPRGSTRKIQKQMQMQIQQYENFYYGKTCPPSRRMYTQNTNTKHTGVEWFKSSIAYKIWNSKLRLCHKNSLLPTKSSSGKPILHKSGNGGGLRGAGSEDVGGKQTPPKHSSSSSSASSQLVSGPSKLASQCSQAKQSVVGCTKCTPLLFSSLWCTFAPNQQKYVSHWILFVLQVCVVEEEENLVNVN